LNAVAPKHISFVSFVAANVLIDIEPLYYMLTKQYPLHRFFHTYVGAGLVSIAAVLLIILCGAVSKNLFPSMFAKFFSSSVGATGCLRNPRFAPLAIRLAQHRFKTNKSFESLCQRVHFKKGNGRPWWPQQVFNFIVTGGAMKALNNYIWTSPASGE